MAIQIVLVNPEIPPNTGNIARTCAATGSILHLVRPLGFDIDDKSLKRAGLDYWPHVKLKIHESLDDFLQEYATPSSPSTVDPPQMFLATTKGKMRYTEPVYRDGDMILFGCETKGLPRDFISENEGMTIRIPMSIQTRTRSFNLANSANIILFEALRQLGFPDLE